MPPGLPVGRQVFLYGHYREVMASAKVVMLKTLKCPVRVVWVFRETQWITLFSTDLDLTTAQIIEYYGASLPAVRQGGKLNPVAKESNRTLGAAKATPAMPMRS